jgi:hypothetical protein
MASDMARVTATTAEVMPLSTITVTTTGTLRVTMVPGIAALSDRRMLITEDLDIMVDGITDGITAGIAGELFIPTPPQKRGGVACRDAEANASFR